jgi:ABC-type spermidine/putrescine transport system permease subunit II
VLLLLYPTLTVPFCTWIMIGYFASIPKELDEAALMDGANYRQILTRVFIPVALPGLIAATIFAFTVSWAQFLYPLAFTTSADQLVLPVGIITTLTKGDVFNWGQIMTGALLGAAHHLRVPDGLLHRRAHRRRHQGIGMFLKTSIACVPGAAQHEAQERAMMRRRTGTVPDTALETVTLSG